MSTVSLEKLKKINDGLRPYRTESKNGMVAIPYDAWKTIIQVSDFIDKRNKNSKHD